MGLTDRQIRRGSKEWAGLEAIGIQVRHVLKSRLRRKSLHKLQSFGLRLVRIEIERRQRRIVMVPEVRPRAQRMEHVSRLTRKFRIDSCCKSVTCRVLHVRH